MVRVNLTASDASFDAIPSGRYRAVVSGGELRTSGEKAKHPGSEYANMEFTILEGDHESRKLWSNIILSHGDCGCDEKETFDKSLGTLVSFLKATGRVTAEDLSSGDFDFNIDDYIGAEVVLTVSQREYEGEMRNEIKRYRPVGADVSSSLMP
jgi:hypothetical protein